MSEETPDEKIASLRDVEGLVRSVKDVDMKNFFNPTETGTLNNIRHKFDYVYAEVVENFQMLKRFTKYLRTAIDANMKNYQGSVDVIQGYMNEEPILTKNRGVSTRTRDTTSADEDVPILRLPTGLSSEVSDGDISSPRNTEPTNPLQGLEESVSLDYKMAHFNLMLWQRIEREVYEPLYTFRRVSLLKLEHVHADVAQKHDQMVKFALKTRQTKEHAATLWNELCDCRARYKKAVDNNRGQDKVKKHAGRVKNMVSKVRQQFEVVMEHVDKLNNMQDGFWSEAMTTACDQLEAMETTRSSFMSEYLRKYVELLAWREEQVKVGYEALSSVVGRLLSPCDAVRLSTHHLLAEFGDYHAPAPNQYEIPCLPEEVAQVEGSVASTRINPSKLNPIHNPFQDAFLPQSQRKLSQQVRSTRGDSFSSFSGRRQTGGGGSVVLQKQRTSFFSDRTTHLLARKKGDSVSMTKHHSLPPSPIVANSDESPVVGVGGYDISSPVNEDMEIPDDLLRRRSGDVVPPTKKSKSATRLFNKPRKSAPPTDLSGMSKRRVLPPRPSNKVPTLEPAKSADFDASPTTGGSFHRISKKGPPRRPPPKNAKSPRSPKDEIKIDSPPMSPAKSAPPPIDTNPKSKKKPALPRKSARDVSHHVRKQTLERAVGGRQLPDRPDHLPPAAAMVGRRSWKMSMDSNH